MTNNAGFMTNNAVLSKYQILFLIATLRFIGKEHKASNLVLFTLYPLYIYTSQQAAVFFLG